MQTIAIDVLPVPSGPMKGLVSAARRYLIDTAEARGITFSLCFDMSELQAVNREAVAAGSWEPMLSTADPSFRRLTPENAFWIKGTDRDGRIVGAQAATLFDCTVSSFGERMEDMTVFYDDPQEQAPAGEWCRCTSLAAHGTRGRVVWTLAGWTHPDFRGMGLFPVQQRVNKLAAWLLWSPDWFVSVVDPDIVPVWSERKMGPRHLDEMTTINYNMASLRLLPMHFVRFSPAQFLYDLELKTQVLAAA
jgi:hypothetical protein